MVKRRLMAARKSPVLCYIEFFPQHLAAYAKYCRLAPYFLHILWNRAIFGVTFAVSNGRIGEG